MSNEPTVFVVDDDPAVRQSLQWLIEAAGLAVKTYDSAQAFLDDYRPEHPGCLLLDIRMPGMNGLDLQEELRAHDITIPVIIVTGHGSTAMAVRAMKTGAVDFIEKPFDDQVLLGRVKHALEQDAQNREERARLAEIDARVALLTPREREVMDMVVAGKSNKQMAAELGISPKTIEAHRGHVMRKMQADSLAELVRLAQGAARLREGPRS